MSSDKTDRLAAVRKKFVASVKERADVLDNFLVDENSYNDWQSLQAMVHKIAGAAGFYGEDDIARVAAQLDVQLQAKPAPEEFANISVELASLIEQIRAL